MLNPEYILNQLKVLQKPSETALLNAMQAKVDWIKINSARELTERQKAALERDKNLVIAAENYFKVMHKVTAFLLNELERAQTQARANFADKLHAEQTLINYISEDRTNGEIRQTA